MVQQTGPPMACSFAKWTKRKKDKSREEEKEESEIYWSSQECDMCEPEGRREEREREADSDSLYSPH